MKDKLIEVKDKDGNVKVQLGVFDTPSKPPHARPRDCFWWVMGTVLLTVLIALALTTPEALFKGLL